MSGIKRTHDGLSKRKHVSLTILQKVEIIRKLDAGTTARLIATEFGISQRTVYDIRKNKDKILEYYASTDTNDGLSDRKSIRVVKSANLDAVLYEWFRQRRSEGIPITGPLLREKAQELHVQLGITEQCHYSKGWLSRFKKRHGIRYLKACGEKLSGDVDAAENFVDTFSDYIKEQGLSPEQVYNADETGLFWRCLPRETLVCAGEKNPSGFKESKERVTVLVCSNAAGTHKSKLLLISKASKPRALKGIKKLPLIYKGNKKAWVTRDLMVEWFENHFVKEAREHTNKVGLPHDCKILLILDNCPAHPQHLEKDNVTVMFLPPNTTSFIQPMDQGVIRSLKSKYRMEFMHRLLALNPSTDTLKDYRNSFTIKDCIFLLAEAWNTLPQDTLINAWHNIWPASLFFEGENSENFEFEGFHINSTREKAAELFNYAKSTLNNVPLCLEEEAVSEWLECLDEAPTIESMTDAEIISSVLDANDSESEDSDCDIDENKINYEQGLELGYKYVTFLQQQSFITEQEIMTINRIQKKIIENKPKLKQTTITSMFKKINNQ